MRNHTDALKLGAYIDSSRGSPTPKDCSRCWTILFLFPKEFYFRRGCLVGNNPLLNINFRILHSIRKTLDYAAYAWGEIIVYIDQLLDEAGALISPEDHDKLLFDDPTFKRSRLYFWAIDALSTFIERIQEVIDTFNTYEKTLINYLNALESDSVRNSISQQRREAIGKVDILESHRRRFGNHLERIKLLRDKVRI